MLHTARTSSVSLHAASTASGLALCAAQPFATEGPAGAPAQAPEWVHLLPAGTIATGDGRGPYKVRDADKVIAASLEQMGGAGVIDENHSTDLAAPRGEAAPARGWIKELQARQDGIWGRVEWTRLGERLVTGKAYRGLSPVIRHDASGNVIAILRASLVNQPNLRGLTALHQENSMSLLEKLIAALGLDAGATEDQVTEKVTSLHAQSGPAATSLQAAMAPIAKAVGLAENATSEAVLAGVAQLVEIKKAAGDLTAHPSVVALQAELTTVSTELKTLREGTARTAAETFVDTAIKAGRVGVKPMREEYISMHMANPAQVEKLIGAMPTLGAGNVVVPDTPPSKDGEISLNAEQLGVAKALGIDPKAYAETLKAERETAL